MDEIYAFKSKDKVFKFTYGLQKSYLSVKVKYCDPFARATSCQKCSLFRLDKSFTSVEKHLKTFLSLEHKWTSSVMALPLSLLFRLNSCKVRFC